MILGEDACEGSLPSFVALRAVYDWMASANPKHGI